MVRAKLASYASRALDPRGFASAPPLRADALESTPANSRRVHAPHRRRGTGRARARDGRHARDADASARTHLRGTRRKWRRRSTCRAVRGDDAARSSTRRVRAMEPKWRRRERRSDPEPRRDERRVCSAAVRRFRVTKRRSRGVDDDSRVLAVARTERRPAPGRFPRGENASWLSDQPKRRKTAEHRRAESCEILRISGRAARHFFFSRRGVSLILGEAVRGAPRGTKRAPRGGGSRATRTMGVMVRPTTARSTDAGLSASQPPRTSRPSAGKHAPGDPLAVMFAGADAIARDALPADPSPVPSPRRPRRAPSPVVSGARSP